MPGVRFTHWTLLVQGYFLEMGGGVAVIAHVQSSSTFLVLLSQRWSHLTGTRSRHSVPLLEPPSHLDHGGFMRRIKITTLEPMLA